MAGISQLIDQKASSCTPPRRKWKGSRLEGRKTSVSGQVVLAERTTYSPPRSKMTRIQKVGKRYEKRALEAIAKLEGKLERNPWIEFHDSAGARIIQPDGIWHTPSGVIVLEMKKTQTAAGYDELEGLYMPVVEALLRKPVAGLLVCGALRWREQPLFPGPVMPGVESGVMGTWFLRV